MDTRISSFSPSVWKRALVAAGFASAWVILSLLIGVGSSDARAEDGDDRGVLGGLLSSVIDETTAAVTDAATHAVDEATAVLHPGVQSAPPVGAGLAAPVVAGVTGLVTRTPIVGDAAGSLGLDDALGSLGGGIDDVIEGVSAGLGDATATIPLPDRPSSPATPSTPLPDAAAGADLVTPAPGDEPGDSVATTARDPRPGSSTLLPGSSPPTPSHLARPAAATASFPLGVPTSAPAFAASAGPGGPGPGAWGVLAFGPLVAHRAWVRRRGPDDERTPPAPLFATDVSPD